MLLGNDVIDFVYRKSHRLRNQAVLAAVARADAPGAASRPGCRSGSCGPTHFELEYRPGLGDAHEVLDVFVLLPLALLVGR